MREKYRIELDLWEAVLAIVVCIAIGVLAMDMAVEIRAGNFPKPTARVEVKPATMPVADPRLVCEHYRMIGQGYRCKIS